MTHNLRRSLTVVILTIFLVAPAGRSLAQEQSPSPVARPSATPGATATDVQPAASISDAPPTASPQTHGQAQHSQPNADGVTTVGNLVEAALAANPEITAMRREFDAAR